VAQIVYKEDEDLFFPVFFGGYSMLAEGVTGVVIGDMTLRSVVHSGTPSLTDITAEVTLHELSSTNKPGWYLVQIDTDETTGTSWDAGDEVTIFIENDNSPPDWREPPPITVMCAPYDHSGLSTQASVDVIDTNVDAILVDTGTTLPATLTTIEGKIDTIDTNVDAILVDTGTTLPATLATIEGKIDTIDTNVDAILVDTGTTLPATLATIEGKIDTIDTVVDAILVDTGITIPATLSTIEGKIDVIDANVDAILVDTGTTIPGLITGMDIIVSHPVAPEIVYMGTGGSDQRFRFGIQIDNAQTGTLVSAANISAVGFRLDRHPEGSGGWVEVYSSPGTATIQKVDGMVYVDLDFEDSDGWLAGDSLRWAFWGVEAVVDGVTYSIGHDTGFWNFRYGKVLGDPGAGGGGGGLTASDVWDLDLTSFTDERTAGGTVNLTKRLVAKIRKMVRKVADHLGVDLGADR
jgi:hypothetical protein